MEVQLQSKCRRLSDILSWQHLIPISTRPVPKTLVSTASDSSVAILAPKNPPMKNLRAMRMRARSPVPIIALQHASPGDTQ
jgi:hypothetical protein